jgi:hypothetical protein
MADGAGDDLFKLAADLGKVSSNTAPYLGKAIAVTAIKVKEAWRGKVGTGIHPALPSTIDYTITGVGSRGGSLIEAEVGFNKSRSVGALGNISEYGTLFHPARGFGAAALAENEADFERGLELAVDDALKAVGL